MTLIQVDLTKQTLFILLKITINKNKVTTMSQYTLTNTFLLIFCSSNLLSLNRIDDPVDPAKRCSRSVVTIPECENIRKKALKIECITEKEYVTLRKYGAYPSCNSLKGEELAMLDGWCPCGCFHPKTKISAYDKKTQSYDNFLAIDILKKKHRFQLVHLSQSSNKNRLYFESSEIRLAIYGPETKKLLSFKTKDQQRPLIVSENHPILTSSGIMKAAKNIHLHDKLIDIYNQEQKITNIEQIVFAGDVINFSTSQEELINHVIVANGYLVGDQYWQTLIDEYKNRVIIRKSSI
jgi:hypothetical protein